MSAPEITPHDDESLKAVAARVSQAIALIESGDLGGVTDLLRSLAKVLPQHERRHVAASKSNLLGGE